MAMALTERRILANQYRILAALNEAERDSYEAKAEALENGYELHYDDPHFTKDEDALAAADSREVIDILAMFDDLFVSFDKLTDRAGLEEEDLAFPGFDGNQETERMAYARYFCERFEGGGRFKSLRRAKGFDYNSHAPGLPRYRAMLREYAPVREARRSPGGGYSPLSAAEIRRVVDVSW